jgi:glycosyltransferase involved in cell wall biosynthesis
MNLRHIRNADVIWTMTEHQAFGVAILFALGLARRRPIIGNAVWLWNEWNGLSRIKKAFFSHLSRYIDVLTVHSADCLEPARRTFPHVRCEVSYFGINTSMFQPAATIPGTADRPIGLFSAGTDRTRDWATFFSAFANDARFVVHVAAPSLSAEDLAHYDNVHLVQNPTMATFLRLYSEADFVVIPMHHNIFSGITVALEAAALKRPIVVSRTGGVPTYFDEQDVFYVAPGDSGALREAVLTATPSQRAARVASAWRRFEKQDYSTNGMMRRYAEFTVAILPGTARATSS